VGELRAIKAQIAALERKPVPQTIFDQYPTSEWAAVGRGQVFANTWSSCGIANVTGLKYDRVEVKYITDRILQGRSEAEVRLAAFRHEANTQYKECVSASNTVRLVGESARHLDVGKWRWIHGIEFGWDYTDTDNAIYTIELQHRNPNDCPQAADDPAVTQVHAYYKMSDAPTPWTSDLLQGDGGNGVWAPGLRPYNGGVASVGWVDVQDTNAAWDGSYSISNMHYCVGMSQERLPSATEDGWHWYTGPAVFARSANVNEEYYRL
jgi:hypothetical protein